MHLSKEGSNLNASKALRSMDYAWAVARRRNQTFPTEPNPQCWSLRVYVWSSHSSYLMYIIFPRCWWQGDNTVKELRNSFTGKMCSLLTSASFFNSVSHHHLVVGHTHEDVGTSDQIILSHLAIILMFLAVVQLFSTLHVCFLSYFVFIPIAVLQTGQWHWWHPL